MRPEPEPVPPLASAPVRAVSGPVAIVLRLEGLAVLVAAVLAYHWLEGGWGLFAILFLAPDLSMLGYLANPRLGAVVYNLGHSYVGPAVIGALGLSVAAPLVTSLAVIWVAHVAFDRALGYGLKGATFRDTHLGRLDPARGLGL